jgi:DNA-binding MarR family transcriptional regulator
MARTQGVTGQQRLVLRVVGKQPGVSASDVAQVLHLHPSTMTGIVQRLMVGGFVERAKSKDDARKVALQLTEKGKKTNDAKGPTIEVPVKRALARFSDAQLDTVRAVLTALAEEFGTKEGLADDAGAKKAAPVKRLAAAKRIGGAPAKKKPAKK